MIGMQIRDLEWLLVLGEQRNVTDAAAVLGISQPTLSRALARVEHELGVRVFERVPSGLEVTPDGQLALEAARDLTGRHRQLRDELGTRLDPERGVVRLAFLDSMSTSLVPELLRGFHDEAPGVRVMLAQEPGHDIVRDLIGGAAELAVTYRPDDPGFEWLPLQDERLVVVVPPRHRLRGRRRIALAELEGGELVTPPQGFGFRGLVEDLLADARVSLPVSFESADLATIEGLVAAGLGVAILPEQFAGRSGTVGLDISGPRAVRRVGVIWRTGRALAPPAARFLEFVRSSPRIA